MHVGCYENQSQTVSKLSMGTEPNLSERIAALVWLARLMLYMPG